LTTVEIKTKNKKSVKHNEHLLTSPAHIFEKRFNMKAAQETDHVDRQCKQAETMDDIKKILITQ